MKTILFITFCAFDTFGCVAPSRHITPWQRWRQEDRRQAVGRADKRASATKDEARKRRCCCCCFCVPQNMATNEFIKIHESSKVWCCFVTAWNTMEKSFACAFCCTVTRTTRFFFGFVFSSFVRCGVGSRLTFIWWACCIASRHRRLVRRQ